MRKHLLFLIFLLPFFLNCKKNEQEKIRLIITSSDWYTTTRNFNNNTFCEVHLKVSGTTNGELLSIETFGDGLIECGEIKCNPEKKFNTDVLICFFPLRELTQKKFGTTLTAYSSKLKPKVSFCDTVGSGDTLSVKLESPILTCK
ncbi:MAG: hypothetical protein M0Q38_06145 [Bacteroidales bacterium]|jgi:hypothetical protein|nr:hypothetical protein [Bacteroidales bacterium]